MEVNSGPIEPREASKSVVLFCSKPPTIYNDPTTLDNTNLSDIVVADKYIPIVSNFTHLGSVNSRDLSDEMGVDRRIQKSRKRLWYDEKVSLLITCYKIENLRQCLSYVHPSYTTLWSRMLESR